MAGPPAELPPHSRRRYRPPPSVVAAFLFFFAAIVVVVSRDKIKSRNRKPHFHCSDSAVVSFPCRPHRLAFPAITWCSRTTRPPATSVDHARHSVFRPSRGRHYAVGRSGEPNKNSPTAAFSHVHTSGDHRRQSQWRGLTQARSEQALQRWARCARPRPEHRRRIVSSCQQLQSFTRLDRLTSM